MVISRLLDSNLRLLRHLERTFTLLGALSALISIGAGAFGAHALKARLSPELLSTFETGVRYQMYHALGLLFTAWATIHLSSRLVGYAGWCFVVGSLLFSGSLYVLALSGVRWLGAVTPLGGLFFLVGWGLLLAAAWLQ